LELWHWLSATLSYFYRETIGHTDPTYFEEYHQCFEQAKPIKKWLVENSVHLHAEALEIARAGGHLK